MFADIFIYTFLLLNGLSGIFTEETLNEVLQKCVSSNDPEYCSEYKMMQFVKKLKMESTIQSGVMQKMNLTETNFDIANMTRLIKLLKDLLLPDMSETTPTDTRSLEEISRGKATPKGMFSVININELPVVLLSIKEPTQSISYFRCCNHFSISVPTLMILSDFVLIYFE